MKRASVFISHETIRQVKAQYGDDVALIAAALDCLQRKFQSERVTLASPGAVREYLRLLFGPLEHEVFIMVSLDTRNRVLAVDEMFRGTLSQTSVYPREVVKKALEHNAASVIFAHNHPSGVAEPSRSDEALTSALRQALALVDVKVFDHFVIGGDVALSFSERGLL